MQDRLVCTVVGASDGLSDGRADVNHTELGALPIVNPVKGSVKVTTTYPFDLVAQRDGVGDDQGFEDTAVERLDGVSRQDAMSDQGKDGFGAILLQNGRRLDEGAFANRQYHGLIPDQVTARWFNLPQVSAMSSEKMLAPLLESALRFDVTYQPR